jgi:hypothetical protein
MKTQPQYAEGPQALANFKKAVQTIFRAPKATIRKPKENQTTSRKSEDHDKS